MGLVCLFYSGVLGFLQGRVVHLWVLEHFLRMDHLGPAGRSWSEMNTAGTEVLTLFPCSSPKFIVLVFSVSSQTIDDFSLLICLQRQTCCIWKHRLELGSPIQRTPPPMNLSMTRSQACNCSVSSLLLFFSAKEKVVFEVLLGFSHGAVILWGSTNILSFLS